MGVLDAGLAGNLLDRGYRKWDPFAADPDQWKRHLGGWPWHAHFTRMRGPELAGCAPSVYMGRRRHPGSDPEVNPGWAGQLDPFPLA